MSDLPPDDDDTTGWPDPQPDPDEEPAEDWAKEDDGPKAG
jgi:hypothetical protein